MTARKWSDHIKSTSPRREVVEVFKTLKLDDPYEQKRMQDLGHLGQFEQKTPVYYNIEVTGTSNMSDCIQVF